MLKSLVEALGIECSCIPRIATGFGGGIARHGETCGALVGAIMALGLKHGREDPNDSAAKTNTYVKVDMLCHAFKDEFGSLICRGLIDCDFRTAEGNERFKRENLINECAKFVSFASRETYRLLKE